MRSIAFALVFLALLAAPMCAVAEAEGTTELAGRKVHMLLNIYTSGPSR
jgi:hypothetical protein